MLIQEGRILVTDENRGGYEMTKFPGGGLEFGEGLEDCLKREFQEELGIEISVDEFYYTNEFLQISRFNEKDQLHSLYYRVSTSADLSGYKEDSKTKVAVDEQHFRWISLDKLNSEEFTFPIDKIVAEKLISELER